MRVDAFLDQHIDQRRPASLEATEHERLEHAGEEKDPISEFETRRHLLDGLPSAPELFRSSEGRGILILQAGFISAAASYEI